MIKIKFILKINSYGRTIIKYLHFDLQKGSWILKTILKSSYQRTVKLNISLKSVLKYMY